jgi:hypothetical protein
MKFVANEDNPLRRAEYLCRKYAEMEESHDAQVSQFLQRAFFVWAQFRQQPGEFERFQVHQFWKQPGSKPMASKQAGSKQAGSKPKDSSTSKGVLYFMMRATTPHLRRLANKFAVILDGLKQDQVEFSAVAARIQELGGIEAAYEAIRARPVSPTQVLGPRASPFPESRVTQNSPNESTPPRALPSQSKPKKLARPTTRTAKPTDEDRPDSHGEAAALRPNFNGLFGGRFSLSAVKPLRPPRKLNKLYQLNIDISQTKEQLSQAQTDVARDFLNKQLQFLEGRARQAIAARAASRQSARDRKLRARWERMNGPR